MNFYPRSPRGERRFKRDFSNLTTIFLSTLPARGATAALRRLVKTMLRISIHAPREGSDCSNLLYYLYYTNFYPRSPRGERLVWEHWENLMGQFLSTLPARGATIHCLHGRGFCGRFLSTLPARGATAELWSNIFTLNEFLSTLPARGATNSSFF